MNKHYDYLVVGAGLYGAVFAHEAKKAGRSVLVIDKRPNIAGNVYTEDMEKIFDRFYRTDASRNSTRGGSGIGLSIVKKILEDHGGKVWATSKEGVGTTMYFVLRKYQEVPVS